MLQAFFVLYGKSTGNSPGYSRMTSDAFREPHIPVGDFGESCVALPGPAGGPERALGSHREVVDL
jgi:hypothetical protein